MKIITQARLFAFIILMAVTALPAAYAQSTNIGTAYAATQTKIYLDTNQPLSTVYMADISTMGLGTEAAAKEFFGRVSDNLITYYVDYPNHKVKIVLHTKRVPGGWSVADWNQYIFNKLNL